MPPKTRASFCGGFAHPRPTPPTPAMSGTELPGDCVTVVTPLHAPGGAPRHGDCEAAKLGASTLAADIEDKQRAAWDSKIQYFFMVISYAVGLGNVWRFPYLCQQHGGGQYTLHTALHTLRVTLDTPHAHTHPACLFRLSLICL